MKKLFIAIMAMFICIVQTNFADAQTFSVSPNKKVLFSPGNLQWSAEGTHTTATGSAPGTWRFANSQYNYISSDNSNISSSYTGWIDLFGWATSGYISKGWGTNPYSSAMNPKNYMLPYNIIDMSGTNHEWGTFNAIYNPKSGNTDAPGTWRSLTKDEWEYLFKSRTDAVYKYGVASIDGFWDGVILLPDDWVLPDGLTFKYGFSDIDNCYGCKNKYTTEQWKQMEAAGAVFLPAAGVRDVNNIISDIGAYWSSTFYNPSGDVYGREHSTRACCLFFKSSNLEPSSTNYVNYGFSVRLVREIIDE